MQLPEPSDVKKLNEYLNTELSVLDLDRVDLNNHTHIAKRLSEKLIQYNRTRPGDVLRKYTWP